jgi:hypothetical protein
MSLLCRGTQVIPVFPQDETADADGNTSTRPPTIGIDARAVVLPVLRAALPAVGVVSWIPNVENRSLPLVAVSWAGGARQRCSTPSGTRRWFRVSAECIRPRSRRERLTPSPCSRTRGALRPQSRPVCDRRQSDSWVPSCEKSRGRKRFPFSSRSLCLVPSTAGPSCCWGRCSETLVVKSVRRYLWPRASYALGAWRTNTTSG